ncbi:MAG: trehalose-phosphatase [Candidatus Krumholzibacteriota bacterium]|nr:trehalose-phosphatase [Candidatus Krumholzibacteriota bacterium]
MKILNPSLDIDLFNKKLSAAPQRILLLDYDGTLAPFTDKRMSAFPYPGIEELISRIILLDRSRVIIISGRTIEDLLKLVRFDTMPELWGSHGWERLLPGEKHIVRGPGPDVESFLGKALEWAIENGLADWVERKPVSMAFHWRGGEPGLENKINTLISSDLLAAAAEAGLEMRPFDGGVELIASGVDKGIAVSSIIDEYGEGSAVAYLGDDLTDEDAFTALGERGLSVLVCREPRDTGADLWIRPPDELYSFLEDWAEICGAGK